MNKQRKHDIGYVIRICMITALGGLLFGYDTAVISGAVSPLQDYFSLSPTMTGWAVSNVVIGCIIGSMFAGRISMAIGRKKALMLSALLFFISALGSALAASFTAFVVFRMIGGLAVGLASVVSPMYMSEVTPKDYRGRTVSMHQQSVVIGQLVVFYVNYLIAKGMSEAWLAELGWRYMLGSEIIPALLLGSLLFLIPESPRWCVLKNRDEDAHKTLSRISNPNHAERLIAEIKASLEEHHDKGKVSLFSPGLRAIVIIGCLIASMQQVIGINVIMYYSPDILKPLAGSTESAMLQTTLIGVVFVAGNAIGMYLIDKLGRVPLLKIGSVGCGIGLALASWGIYTESAGYTALIGLILYVIAFAISWGCCCWTLISEIFPNRIRSRAMALAVACQWASGFVVTQTFPMLSKNAWLNENFNGAFSFWLYACMTLVALWFVIRYVPETKGVSLEKMEQHFQSQLSKKERASVIPDPTMTI